MPDAPVFQILDSTTNLKAFVSYDADPAKAFVTIMDGARVETFTMTLADFRRLAATVENQF